MLWPNGLRAIPKLLLIACVLVPPVAAQKQYTFTIYVNEGKGELHGHVWIGLSDGTKEGTYGFNPKNRWLASIPDAVRERSFGGQIEVESNEHCDVRLPPYSITEADYHRVLEAIRTSGSSGESWCPTNHCGDWAKRIADVAGVHIDLPRYDFDRPGAFGTYVRQHGGQTCDGRPLSSDFDGQWRCSETGELVMISQRGGKYYATFFGIHWVLTRSGEELSASQGLTAAEVATLFSDAPADVTGKFVGMPAVLVMTLSDKNHITYATTAPRSISRTGPTAKLELGSGATRAGTLIRVQAGLDKDPDGSYNNSGPSDVPSSQSDKTSEIQPPSPNAPRPGITVQFERQPGRTGIWVHGAGGQVLDSTEQNTYGMVNLVGFKNLNPGDYVFDFTQPGFGRLPVKVRQGFVTSITASPAILTLRHEDKKTCACLSDPSTKRILNYLPSAPICVSGTIPPSGFYAPSQFAVGPGNYEVVTVDSNMWGGCTTRLRSGSTAVPVTLQPKQTLTVMTHGAGPN